MKRLVFLMSSIAVLAGSPAQSAPDGVPARPRSIGRWYDHDPNTPQPGYEPWTPADAAGFLQLYPDAHLEVFFNDGKPPGHRKSHEMGSRVRELESILRQRGVNATGRICMSGDRPDVLARLVDDTGPCNPRNGGGGCDWEGDMDGSHGEAETVVKVAGRVTAATPTSLADSGSKWQTDLYYRRLLVLHPGSAKEERHRIVANDSSSLTIDGVWRNSPRPGDRYEVRGSFDPAWVKQIPLGDHEDAVRRLWPSQRTICGTSPCPPPQEPLDPFVTGNRRGWVPWVDRRAIEALRTPTSVPALYGSVYDGDRAYGWGERPARWNDPHFAASSVVMDVANPAYREWHLRYLLYQLEDHGIAPGQSACIVSAYKPGLHARYDDANGGSGKPCSVAGSGNWVGPAHVCQDGTAIGGPLHPTPFAPGEYEAAINSYFRELTATLPANGYSNLRIITAEAPAYRDTTWSTLADDVRRNPRIVGEQGGWVEPRLSALTSLPAPGASAPGDSGVASEPAAAIAPAAPDFSGTGSGATDPGSQSGGHVSSSNGGGGGTINAPSIGN